MPPGRTGDGYAQPANYQTQLPPADGSVPVDQADPNQPAGLAPDGSGAPIQYPSTWGAMAAAPVPPPPPPLTQDQYLAAQYAAGAPYSTGVDPASQAAWGTPAPVLANDLYGQPPPPQYDPGYDANQYALGNVYSTGSAPAQQAAWLTPLPVWASVSPQVNAPTNPRVNPAGAADWTGINGYLQQIGPAPFQQPGTTAFFNALPGNFTPEARAVRAILQPPYHTGDLSAPSLDPHVADLQQRQAAMIAGRGGARPTAPPPPYHTGDLSAPPIPSQPTTWVQTVDQAIPPLGWADAGLARFQAWTNNVAHGSDQGIVKGGRVLVSPEQARQAIATLQQPILPYLVPNIDQAAPWLAGVDQALGTAGGGFGSDPNAIPNALGILAALQTSAPPPATTPASARPSATTTAPPAARGAPPSASVTPASPTIAAAPAASTTTIVQPTVLPVVVAGPGSSSAGSAVGGTNWNGGGSALGQSYGTASGSGGSPQRDYSNGGRNHDGIYTVTRSDGERVSVDLNNLPDEARANAAFMALLNRDPQGAAKFLAERGYGLVRQRGRGRASRSQSASFPTIASNGRSGPLANPIFDRYFAVANQPIPAAVAKTVIERQPVTSAGGASAGPRRASTGGQAAGKRKK